MPIADGKKCQTLINACGRYAQQLQAIATRLKYLRAQYQAQGVDPTGTPLDGNVAAVSSWIDEVDAAANNAVANGLIDEIFPNHPDDLLD